MKIGKYERKIVVGDEVVVKEVYRGGADDSPDSHLTNKYADEVMEVIDINDGKSRFDYHLKIPDYINADIANLSVSEDDVELVR